MSVSVMSMATDSSPVSESLSPDCGELSVHFCAPLWGVPHARTYTLSPAVRDGVWWLQSIEEPVTTFVLADPFVIDPSYAVDLGEAERTTLAVTSADGVLALIMLTLPAGGAGDVTGNFRAPIVINVHDGKALQVVSRDERHSLRGPVALAAYALRTDTTPAS